MKTNFRACAIDPERRDTYVSYHGKDDTRKLSTQEYYDVPRTIRRIKNEETRKAAKGIKKIETNIPTPKTQLRE